MNELVIMEGVKKGTGTGAGSNSGTGGGGAKRGRKPKNQPREYILKEEQRKFTADLSDEEEQRKLILELIGKANSKAFGREILFKDIVIYAFSKVTDKDIAKIQENSLSSKEKAERVVAEYNVKHGLNLSLEEFVLLRDGK